MDHKKYRYNHIGIPTTEKRQNEKYLAMFDLYISDCQENEFNIEWLRFGKNCQLPEIVGKLPHVAFEVDDIDKAIKGHEVIIEPNSPSEGVIVTFILADGAPVELLQYTNR